MYFPLQCQNCFKAHDFQREAYGSCSTCKKKHMCETCCYEHKCLEGKNMQLQMIINPSWIYNLMKSIEEKDE